MAEQKVKGILEFSKETTMSNINRPYNNAFVHVPKTAGTSMEGFWFVGGNAHAPAKTLKAIAGDKWRDLFTWGFVRDPLDRTVSAFFHEPKLHEFPLNKDGFKDFLIYLKERGIEIEDSLNGSGLFHHHFIPQNYFLCDENGKILVEYVGRYSHLEDDWMEVCQRIVETTYDLPHFRKGNHKHYTHFHDKVTIELVKDIYSEDYEIFGEYF